MTQLDQTSWVRLPVPLSALRTMTGSVNEAFTPADSMAIPADLDEDDPSSLFEALSRDGDDQLVSDQVFAPPVAPYRLSPVSSLRSLTKLRVYAFPYSLNAGREDVSLTSVASATALRYPAAVRYAITRALASTAINDQPPVSPELVTLLNSTQAPVLGAEPVSDVGALAEEYQVLYNAAPSGDWVDEDGYPIRLNDWVSFGGTSYATGVLTTNSYVAVPQTAAVTYTTSLTNPAAPKLMVGAGDYRAGLLLVQEGTNYTRVRAELRPYAATAGTTASLIWEATFFQPSSDGTQYIEVRIGNVRSAELASPDLVLASASAAYASVPLSANTSYVFIGNPSGSNWTVSSGYHAVNRGVYARRIQASTRVRALVANDTALLAVVRPAFEEKPSQFFSALRFAGTSAAKTIATPNLYPALVIHRAGTTTATYTNFGGPALNRAGANTTTGGSQDTPKYSSLSVANDRTDDQEGFLEFGPGYYKLGTSSTINPYTNPGIPCDSIFAWVLGGVGAPRRNSDGVAKGGVASWVNASNWGFSSFAWVGVSPLNLPANGLAVGHGLRDRQGNRLKPEIVFVKGFRRSDVTVSLRRSMSVAGEVLGTNVTTHTPGSTGNYFLMLANQGGYAHDGSSNLGTSPAYYSGSAYHYGNNFFPNVADEECVYLNSNGQNSIFTSVGFAFANVPGSCKVGRLTSEGMVSHTVVTNFPVRMVILKCITAASSWLLFGQQACLTDGALRIDSTLGYTTAGGSVTFSGATFTWTNRISDPGQEWLYIAVGGYGPDEVVEAAYLEPTSYALNGISAGSRRQRIMPCQEGVVAAAGQPAVLAQQRRPLAAAAGALVLDGLEAVLWTGIALAAELGAVELEGSPAAVYRPFLDPLLAGSATLVLTGQPATLVGPRDNYWSLWGDQLHGWEAEVFPEWWAA